MEWVFILFAIVLVAEIFILSDGLKFRRLSKRAKESKRASEKASTLSVKVEGETTKVMTLLDIWNSFENTPSDRLARDAWYSTLTRSQQNELSKLYDERRLDV